MSTTSMLSEKRVLIARSYCEVSVIDTLRISKLARVVNLLLRSAASPVNDKSELKSLSVPRTPSAWWISATETCWWGRAVVYLFLVVWCFFLWVLFGVLFFVFLCVLVLFSFC